MKTLVAYYSNTGKTRRVAELLARELDADLAEVTCERYLRWYGPMVMAWDIFTRHLPLVTITQPNDSYDRVVIGGPVWAAKAAPPVLALSSRWRGTPKALFVTCSGASPNSPPEPAIEEMRAALADGQDAPNRIFREPELHSERLNELTQAFAEEIKTATRPP